jgi:hypothetical protein
MSLFNLFGAPPPDDGPAIGHCPCGQAIMRSCRNPWCPACGERFQGELLTAFRAIHPAPQPTPRPIPAGPPAPPLPADLVAKARQTYRAKLALTAILMLIAGRIANHLDGFSGYGWMLAIPLYVVGSLCVLLLVIAFWAPAANPVAPQSPGVRLPDNQRLFVGALLLLGVGLSLMEQRMGVPLLGGTLICWLAPGLFRVIDRLIDQRIARAKTELAQRIRPLPSRLLTTVFLLLFLPAAAVAPNVAVARERELKATVKSNAHSVQTMVEDYAIDYSGQAPATIAELRRAATANGYWKELLNPYDPTAPGLIDATQPPVGGAVTYRRTTPREGYYELKGYDRHGRILSNRAHDFTLVGPEEPSPSRKADH